MRASRHGGYQQERDTLSIPLFRVTDAIASFRWTLDEVKALHGLLSAAMRSETNHMDAASRPR